MIKGENLEMSYGAFKALNDVSFEVKKGEIVGLLGPNGAGKSTTMKILTTYIHPTGGKATVDGIDVVANSFEVRARIGYLPEVLPIYPDMEVKDYLSFVGKARNLSGRSLATRIEWVVEHCGLKLMYRKLCRELSKGYKQRVGLGQALIHDPPIIILDEPTSGLDPHQIVEIRNLIRGLGKTKTVILSTHILQEAQAISDRIVIINRGKIVGDGTIADLRKRAHRQEKVFLSVLGDKDPVYQSLKGISACNEVIYLEEIAGYHKFEMQGDNSDELLNIVGEMAKSKQWQMGLLKDVPYSLEETFLALTETEIGDVK